MKRCRALAMWVLVSILMLSACSEQFFRTEEDPATLGEEYSIEDDDVFAFEFEEKGNLAAIDALSDVAEQQFAVLEQEIFDIQVAAVISMMHNASAVYRFDFNRDYTDDRIVVGGGGKGMYMFLSDKPSGASADVFYDTSVAGGCWLEYSRRLDALLIFKNYATVGRESVQQSVYRGAPEDNIAAYTRQMAEGVVTGEEYVCKYSIEGQQVDEEAYEDYVSSLGCVALSETKFVVPIDIAALCNRKLECDPSMIELVAENLVNRGFTEWQESIDINDDGVSDYLLRTSIIIDEAGQPAPAGIDISYYQAGSTDKVDSYDEHTVGKWQACYINLISGSNSIEVVVGDYDSRFLEKMTNEGLDFPAWRSLYKDVICSFWDESAWVSEVELIDLNFDNVPELVAYGAGNTAQVYTVVNNLLYSFYLTGTAKDFAELRYNPKTQDSFYLLKDHFGDYDYSLMEYYRFDQETSFYQLAALADDDKAIGIAIYRIALRETMMEEAYLNGRWDQIVVDEFCEVKGQAVSSDDYKAFIESLFSETQAVERANNILKIPDYYQQDDKFLVYKALFDFLDGSY